MPSTTRRPSPSASPPATRSPAASCCGPGSRPNPSPPSSSCPRSSRSNGPSPRTPSCDGSWPGARRPRPPRSATACTSRSSGLRPGATTGTLQGTRQDQPRRPYEDRARRPLSRVRFAAANCQAFHDGYYAAHRGIARENVDFVVHLGDYIYEHGQVGGITESHVRDHDGPEILTLGDYRKRHALYKGDASLREAHAAHPWFLTWDDHEVVNDYSGTGGGAPFMKRRAAAYQAWFEHMPHRDSFGGSALPDPEIHRVRRWGDLLELTVLDLRCVPLGAEPAPTARSSAPSRRPG